MTFKPAVGEIVYEVVSGRTGVIIQTRTRMVTMALADGEKIFRFPFDLREVAQPEIEPLAEFLARTVDKRVEYNV
jgi:hypothetical protein